MNNCINCENFAWWDGDYCCLKKMLILQSSPNGNFEEEFLKTMKSSDECANYSKSDDEMHKIYENTFDKLMQKITPHD